MSVTNAVAKINQKDLKSLDELDIEIEGYKEKYSSLTIADENDKAGIESVREALSVMRPRRTGLDKERKAMTEPYRDAVNFINKKYDEKISMISSIEEPLKSRKKEIDDIIENKKKEEERKEEEKINNRINELLKMGMAFDGEYYSIKHEGLGISETSVGVVDVRTMSDDLYKSILQVVMDKSATIKQEEERIANEQKEAQLKKQEEERVANEKRDFELKKQQELIDEQNKKIREMEENEERRKKEELDRAENDRKKLSEVRCKQLELLGMKLDVPSFVYIYKDVSVDVDKEVCLLEESDWSTLLERIKPVIARYKEEDAALLEREKEENENRIKQKAIDELKEKEREEKERCEEELAKSSDRDKYEYLIAKIREIVIPEMKSNVYKSKVKPISEFISKL